MSYSKLLVITIMLSLIIIILKKIMFSSSEKFNVDLKTELDIMETQDPSIQDKIFYDTIDKSVDVHNIHQDGKLIPSNDEKLIDIYVNELINKDKGNPNKLLIENKEELPKAPYNNYTKYNHEMRLLIDSKKIKQDNIITILKNKLKILNNSLKNIKEVKNKYDLDDIPT